MVEPIKEPEKRKAFRRANDERLDFIQSVVDSLSEPVTIINEQYQLICLNQAARKMLSDESSGTMPLICHMCNHGKESPCLESDYPCPVKKAKESGKSVSVVHEHILPGGEARDFEIIATPLWSKDGAFQGVAETLRDITDRRKAEQEREQLIADLQKALSMVKALSGLLPICASCKKIRDDKGYWNQIEAYISEHSEAEFSHGICPDCARKIYGTRYKEET
jgi:transcriptional regulator with PAS, ATPase and Fis domain